MAKVLHAKKGEKPLGKLLGDVDAGSLSKGDKVKAGFREEAGFRIRKAKVAGIGKKHLAVVPSGGDYEGKPVAVPRPESDTSEVEEQEESPAMSKKAREMADEADVTSKELASIAGSGKDGKIIVSDIRAYLEHQEQEQKEEEELQEAEPDEYQKMLEELVQSNAKNGCRSAKSMALRRKLRKLRNWRGRDPYTGKRELATKFGAEA